MASPFPNVHELFRHYNQLYFEVGQRLRLCGAALRAFAVCAAMRVSCMPWDAH